MEAVAESGVDGDAVVARLAALREQLRAEQAETDERRHHSPALHEAIVASGVYRVLLPRRFGGLELGLADFYRAIMEIARGCPSTGWCVCLAGSHVLTVASLFDAEVQERALGPDGDFRCPARALPTGTATPTADGGWTVTGRWDYCSGAPYATHLLAAVQMEHDGAPRVGCALIERDQWRMLDDWGAQLGLKGSGSHSIEADAVLPLGQVLPVTIQAVVPGEQTPGHRLHGNAMYAGPTSGFYSGELAAIGVGMVRGALDTYADILRARRTAWVPQVVRAHDPQHQEWYGHAQMLVDTAEGALLHMTRLYHAYCDEHVAGGAPFTVGRDTRLMAIVLHASARCVEAMDLLIRTAGASSLTAGSRMERLWRDVSTFRTHLSQTMRESVLTTAGAAPFGGRERAQFKVGAAT